jgi:hypothetical protein
LECGSVLPLWELGERGYLFPTTAASTKESGGAPPQSKKGQVEPWTNGEVKRIAKK